MPEDTMNGPDASVCAWMEACRRMGLNVRSGDVGTYLQDESHFRGHTWAAVRVLNEGQAITAVRNAHRFRVPLTVSAGRTSVTGASVPRGGVVMDMSGLNQINEHDPRRVGPGCVLRDYRRHVAECGLFYPPDPTSEASCTIGGTVACNASGAISYLYGPTRGYIRGLRVLLADGSVMDVERGRVVSEGGFLTIPGRLFEPQRNADLRIRIPARTAPRWRDVKNAAGLHWSQPLDLVDLFVGSEGILGVTLEVRTNVLPARDPFFGLMVTLPSRALTLTLVHFLDNLRRMRAGQSPTARTQVASVLGRLDPDGDTLPIEAVSRLVPSCMEWLGASTAKFVTTARRARALAGSYGCLYIEQEYAPREDPLDYASTWAGLIDRLDRMADGSPAGIMSEIALDERQIRAFREEREAVPEHLNRSIRPGLVKVGTDYAVPMDHLETLLELYERRLADIDHCVFGHIGNAHLHVNMLPKTAGELEEFRGLARTLAREICAMGGTVSAEHGIGKLKQELLEIMVGREGVQAIRAAKEQFDPQGILCPGNMVH